MPVNKKNDVKLDRLQQENRGSRVQSTFVQVHKYTPLYQNRCVAVHKTKNRLSMPVLLNINNVTLMNPTLKSLAKSHLDSVGAY